MTDATSKTVHALSELRHACGACGHCCHGHRVRLEDDEEIAKIEAHGVHFGIADPVVDRAMRVEDDGCVFLDTDKLCRIHKVFGSAAKPRICQQYPVRVGLTEEGFRVGIDPGCSNNWVSWRSGPITPFTSLVRPHDNRRSSPDGAEARLLAIASEPGMSVAGMLRAIAAAGGAPAEGGGDDLPDDYAGRLSARLKAMKMARFLAEPAAGNALRQCLGHLPALIDTLDPEAPPSWRGRLGEDNEAFSLDTLKRHIFLRVGDEPLPDFGQAIVLLSGAVTCGWADPSPEVYGQALSSWSKAMRHRAFWAALIPRPETLRWLVTGITQ
jgi:Fe-S-cluster containining protein